MCIGGGKHSISCPWAKDRTTTSKIPLWKFLYQGLNNTWLRRIAHGRGVFVLPFHNIGTTVFLAELVQQLKARNVDLDRLASYRTRQQGTQLQQKEATQQMAREVAQHMQSWLPTAVAPDPTSQQRILDLEAQLANLKAQHADGNLPSGTTPSGSTPARPIVQSLYMVSLRLPPPFHQALCS